MTKQIVAVVVDTRQLTIYQDDGSSYNIPQGDPRVARIVDEVLPIIRAGGTVDADYREESSFAEFEQNTNGFVRFFRATKKAFADVFSDPSRIQNENTAQVGQFGQVPTLDLGQEQAISEIIANAEPVSDANYDDSNTTEEDTIVAVVGNTVIPGAEKLHPQIKNAVKLGSTKGVENFFKRIASVIDSRRHSIDDLLKFMEKGDLPIADDGSIIAYKVLNNAPGKSEYFVDCHSSKVFQKVGSYVFMDPKMVDPDRRNECSNGLHIARRGYIGGFGGNVCVLVKIAPEDVIAVPQHDANKMRVCGYHILFQLGSDAFSKLKRNKSMTDNPEAQKMLGAALAGQHIDITQRVKITEGYGGGLKIEDIENAGNNHQLDQAPVAQSIKTEDDAVGRSIDPKAVAKKHMPSKPSNRITKARDLVGIIVGSNDAKHRAKAAQQLLDLKKASKVGWDKLTVTPKEVELTLQMAAPESTAIRVPTPAATSAKPVEDAVTQVMAKVVHPTPAKSAYNRRDAAAELKAILDGQGALNHRQQAATDLLALKKKSKVSWSGLGLPESVLVTIEITLAEKPAPIAKKASPKPATKQPSKTAPKVSSKPIASAPVSGETRSQKARRLFNNQDWLGLTELKRKSKVGYDVLGFNQANIITIRNELGKLNG